MTSYILWIFIISTSMSPLPLQHTMYCHRQRVHIFYVHFHVFWTILFWKNVECVLSHPSRQIMYIPSSFIYGTFSTLNNSVESECLIFLFSFFIFCILARIILFHVFFSMYNHEPNVRVFTKFFFIKNNMYYFFLCLHQSRENNEKLRRIWFFILSHSKLFPSLHRIFVHLAFSTAFLYLLNQSVNRSIIYSIFGTMYQIVRVLTYFVVKLKIFAVITEFFIPYSCL